MTKRTKTILISLAAVIVALSAAILIFTQSYYRADEVAEAVLEQDNVEVFEKEGYIRLSPTAFDISVGIIFYPGANVEHTAYLPLLSQLAERGYTCYLVKMPLKFAILDPNKADDIFEKHGDEHEYWIMAGHSLGSAMASQYAAENADKVDALILVAGYPYGEYPIEKTLTVYGSLNTSVEEKIDYEENVVVIEGANHAYFGNYGEQAGDPVAEISREEQQALAVDAISTFIQIKILENLIS